MSGTYEEAIQPLLDAHAAIEADVAEKERELGELKDRRNRLRNAVRALDPERLPSQNGAKAKMEKKRYVAEDSLSYIRDFVRDHPELGVFGSTQLVDHEEYEGVGASTLPPYLRALHDEGTLRLARTGKGQSRYYEVIR